MNYNIYIPENINLEALFKRFPPSFKFKIDIFYYLIYYVLKNPFTTKNKTTSYLSLCSKAIRKNVHENYNLYLDHLESMGILERIFKNEEGKCDLYRISNDLIFDKLVSYEITDFVLRKKHKKQSDLDKKTVAKYSYLTKFLLDGKLSVDFVHAAYELEKSFELVLEDKRLSNVRKYQFAYITLQNFKNNYQWIVNNPKSDNRLHTNLTNMPKFLKQFVKYDGKTLKGIDIKNSQPLMLYIVLNTILSNDNSSKIYPVIEDLVGNSTIINLRKNATSTVIAELGAYKKCVLEGKFYEYLGKKYLEKNPDAKVPFTLYNYDKTLDCPTPEDFYSIRDYMKKLSFDLYYASNKKPNSKFKKLFNELFPNLSKIIFLLKEKDYILMSRLMQQVESFIILENITKTIYNKFKIPQFTIHDSVATTPENFELLIREFSKEFERITGFIPPLGEEDWGREVEMFREAA